MEKNTKTIFLIIICFLFFIIGYFLFNVNIPFLIPILAILFVIGILFNILYKNLGNNFEKCLFSLIAIMAICSIIIGHEINSNPFLIVFSIMGPGILIEAYEKPTKNLRILYMIYSVMMIFVLISNIFYWEINYLILSSLTAILSIILMRYSYLKLKKIEN